MPRSSGPPDRGRRRDPIDLLYPTLDLHGHTGEEAERAVHGWLADRIADGEPVVRLITGRGLHSAGPPVLPGVVEALLDELKGSAVERWEREAGGGVYRVRLRRGPQAASPPVRRPSAPEGDPDVRRAAEEALAELGITPTPALLAAEAKRIREARRTGQ